LIVVAEMNEQGRMVMVIENESELVVNETF